MPDNTKPTPTASDPPSWLVFLQNIADATTAIKTSVDNITSVLNKLNPPRAVVLQIFNYTDQTLIKTDEHHAFGGWATNPSDQIPPKTALIFGSRSSVLLQGTEGRITYAGEGFKITASWSDPWWGFGTGNTCALSIAGATQFKYHLNHECTVGIRNTAKFELNTTDVQFISPAPNSTIGGTINLHVHASAALGMKFTAYYCTNPNDINTVGWHDIGSGTLQDDGTWVLAWDSRQIPAQSNAGWGTVNLCAMPIDADGKPLGDAAYCRVNVDPTQTKIVFPKPNTVISGTVELTAQSSAEGVLFSAYYATNPMDINTVGWHELGRAAKGFMPGVGIVWTLNYNTKLIPSQGNGGEGLVNICSVPVGPSGNLLVNRDYSRVDVKN